MEILAAIIALAIGTSGILIMFSLLYTGVRYVPFVPTPLRVVRQMIDAADLQGEERVYDLGCGDGRLLIEASKKKNISGYGFEINWIIFLLAKLKVFFSGKKIHISKKNFYSEPLHSADIVFCYLFPKIMQQLDDKFRRELKKGAKIISYCFPLKNWKPTAIIQTKKSKPQNFLIYVYQA